MDCAISLHVGQIGYFWGFAPGTQTLPQSAITGVALIMAPTTELSRGTNSPSLGCSPEDDVREALVVLVVDPASTKSRSLRSRSGAHVSKSIDVASLGA